VGVENKDPKTGSSLPAISMARGRKGIRNKFHADFITDLHDHKHMTGADIAAGGLTRGQAAIKIVYRENRRVLPIKTARMYCGGNARRLPYPDYVRNEQKFGAK